MTGSGLIDFVITLIVLIGTGMLFFIAIDKMAPDETLKQIAKVAVGVVLLVVFLVAVKGVIFGGGAMAASGSGMIQFAVGLIVILVVLFLIDKVLMWVGSQISPPIVEMARYVIFAIALIALLLLVDKTFFAGHYAASLGIQTPSIMQEKR